jgi:hypothetical protein
MEALTIEARNRLAPVEVDRAGVVVLPCEGALHHAALHGDTLELAEHDVGSELPLLVFGGSLPPCLIYQEVWCSAFSDGFFASWAADPDGARINRDREEWYENYWESWPSEPAAARALFGPALQGQLAVEVARAWVASRGPDGPGAMWTWVRRAITMRARSAFVASLASVHAHRRPDALVPVAISVTPAGPPRIHGRLATERSRVELTLPIEWLWTVWARGLAVVDGRFVLGVDGRAPSGIELVEWTPTGNRAREHEPRRRRVDAPAA